MNKFRKFYAVSITVLLSMSSLAFAKGEGKATLKKLLGLSNYYSSTTKLEDIEFYNMGATPKNTEIYIAVLKLTEGGEEALKNWTPNTTYQPPSSRKKTDSSYVPVLKRLDIAAGIAEIDFIRQYKEGIKIAFYKYHASIPLYGNLVVEVDEWPEELFLSDGHTSASNFNAPGVKWEKCYVQPYEENETRPPVVYQELIATNLMALLEADNYAELEKSVVSQPRTWDYISSSSANEQELAKFFSKHGLLGDLRTWQYVYNKCQNNVQFDRFLNNYNLLKTKFNVPCTFRSIDMTDASEKSKYNNKKYVASFILPFGTLRIYTDNAKYSDYIRGDTVVLNTVFSSYESSDKNNLDLIAIE